MLFTFSAFKVGTFYSNPFWYTVCSTVFCGGVSGPRMLFTFPSFKVGSVQEVGGFVLLANSWNCDDSCSMAGLVSFLLAETSVFI